MAKEDDLTLQIGFEPDLRSLQKAAQAGAEAYSKSFSKELEKKLKLPEGYSRNFEKGHHLHNAQILAADDFIRDSEVQKYTRLFKEAALCSIQGITKGLTKSLAATSDDVIKIFDQLNKADSTWRRALQHTISNTSASQPRGLLQKAQAMLDQQEQVKPRGLLQKAQAALNNSSIVKQQPFTLVGGVYTGRSGEVNWSQGHYPLPQKGYDQLALPEHANQPYPEKQMSLPEPDPYRPRGLLQKATALLLREENKKDMQAFRESLQNAQGYNFSVDKLRMQDLSNANRIHKHFDMPDSEYYNSQLTSAANFGKADPAYRLHATQFIKDTEYRKKFTEILNTYGAPEGFFEMPAASTWKYHPLFAHGRGGLVRHTDAVMQSVYKDAVALGMSPKDTDKLLFAAGLHDALKYVNGRPNSNHASDMKFVLQQMKFDDEGSWIGTHMGPVQSGYGKGEGPEPGNIYQKLLADDDFLNSRRYAQFFVDWQNGSMSPDIDALREYSVKVGEGRWINPDKPHTADNWERIVKDTDETGKNSKEWLLNLRNIAGILAVIHTLTKAVKAVKAFDSKAVAATAEAATTLPNRRYYAGYDVKSALENTSAAKSVGIDKTAVNSDIINFSANRGQMSLLGKGFNLLPVSILGQWQNMMQEGDANTAWWNTLSAVSGRYNSASQKEREQLQKLVDDTLGKSATEILAFSKNNNIPIEDIRKLRENPNWSAVEEVEKLNLEIIKLTESIEASYQSLYNTWEKLWGLPFREKWDEFLQGITAGMNKINEPIFRNAVLNELEGYTTTIDRATGTDRSDFEYSRLGLDDEEAVARRYGVYNFTEGVKATEGILFTTGDRKHAIAQYSIATGIRNKLKSIDYSNPRLETFLESTLYNPGKSDLDKDAVIFADDLNKFLKKQGKNPDKAAIDEYINKYFDTVLPLSKIIQGIPLSERDQRNDIYNKIVSGDLAINIYTEMSRDGRLDVSRVVVDGEDIVTKVNSIPANK